MIVIFTFYRNFIWFSNFITLFSCWLLAASGLWTFTITAFWIKIFTNVFLGLYVHIFHAGQYAFFRNLGFGKARLYTCTFLLDMGVWIALSLLVIQLGL